VLEARAGDDGNIAMDAVKIARADIVEEQARGPDRVLDPEVEVCLNCSREACWDGEEVQGARRCERGRKGKVQVVCARADGGGGGGQSVVVCAPQPLPACVRQGQANECRRGDGVSLNAEAAAWKSLVALLLAGLAGGADLGSAGVVGGAGRGAVGGSRLSGVGAGGAGGEGGVEGRRGRHIQRIWIWIWSAWPVGSDWSLRGCVDVGL
jgi:hypothetical protein